MRNHRSDISLITIFLLIIATGIPCTAQSPIPEDATLEHLESGFLLSEGPLWHPDGYLLFSDVSSSIIYKWTEDSGLVKLLDPSGQTNGITLDLDGNLIIAQHQARQVGQLEEDGTVTPIVTHYNGKRFHSPNDLAIKSDGAIFFTDPPWGGNPAEMSFHGVYRIPPNRKEAQLLESGITYPNGIAFSPDESKLYVDDSGGRHIYVFDVIDDSVLVNKRLFARVARYQNQGCDGMKVDDTGNLWVTGSVGVVVYSPQGEVLDSITVRGLTTNLNWGGENGKMLYICTFTDLYRIDLADQTNITLHGFEAHREIRLHQNYPNPFNPSTTLSFDIPETMQVKLSIYNISGQILSLLVEQEMKAGSYIKEFDASAYSSGFYIYELLAGDERLVGRMQLVK